MPEKRRMSEKDKSKIAEKMSDFILLMGYNADFQVIIAKELNRHIWMSSENLGRKQCRELLYLLYMADSSTLLSFLVSLGRLVWGNHLRAKRRIVRSKLLEKIKQREWSRQKKRRRGKPGLVVMMGRGGKLGAMEHKNGSTGSWWVRIGFRLRPVFRSVVARRRAVKCRNAEVGSRIFRLALAMCFLSFRNVCVTSEWEFWAMCLVKQVFGFWRSIAIGGELDGSFTRIAIKLGFDVVSCELLERLQSCLRCSSTTRYPGSGRE